MTTPRTLPRTFLEALLDRCLLRNIRRYLVQCERDEAQATDFLKTIWKLANPKEPKQPKNSKKPL